MSKKPTLPVIIASLIKEHPTVTRKPRLTPASIVKLHTALYEQFADNRDAWRNYFKNNPNLMTNKQLEMLKQYRSRVKGCQYVRNFRERKKDKLIPACVSPANDVYVLDAKLTHVVGTGLEPQNPDIDTGEFTGLALLATVAIYRMH